MTIEDMLDIVGYFRQMGNHALGLIICQQSMKCKL
jgi:DNA polymerase III alpha subunit